MIKIKKYCECCGYRDEYNTEYSNNPYPVEQRGRECPKCHCKALHVTAWAYLHTAVEVK